MTKRKMADSFIDQLVQCPRILHTCMYQYLVIRGLTVVSVLVIVVDQPEAWEGRRIGEGSTDVAGRYKKRAVARRA